MQKVQYRTGCNSQLHLFKRGYSSVQVATLCFISLSREYITVQVAGLQYSALFSYAKSTVSYRLPNPHSFIYLCRKYGVCTAKNAARSFIYLCLLHLPPPFYTLFCFTLLKIDFNRFPRLNLYNNPLT